MRKILFIVLCSFAAPLSAQTPAAPSTLRLTVDDAVRMALDHNVELTAARLDPQISDTRVAAAAGAFKPTSDTRLRETLVHTTANVKSTYWALVAAVANVDARRTAVELAQELERVNKAKVDVGQSPPLDLVSAQAEVASNREQLIIAETAVKLAEDKLRLLIFDTGDRSVWNVKVDPIDAPPITTAAVDVDAAVTNALRDRTDLVRA